jgi:hypothetical protein
VKRDAPTTIPPPLEASQAPARPGFFLVVRRLTGVRRLPAAGGRWSVSLLHFPENQEGQNGSGDPRRTYR